MREVPELRAEQERHSALPVQGGRHLGVSGAGHMMKLQDE